MCLVDWLPSLAPVLHESEFKIIYAIMHAGRDGYGEAGQPCIMLSARLEALAEDAGIAPRSATLGSLSLEAAGVLTVFLSKSPHGENKYRLYVHLPRRLIMGVYRDRDKKLAPLDKNREAKLAPLPNEGSKTFQPLNNPGGGGAYPSTNSIAIESRSLLTTPPQQNREAKLAPLLQELKSLGVVVAKDLIAEYPAERIQAAIDYVTDPMAQHVRTPANYLVYLVRADTDIPDPPSKKKPVEPPIPTWTGPASASASRTWEQALGQLRLDISDTNYKTWMAGTIGLDCKDGKFIIGVPSKDKIDWLSRRLSSLVRGRLIDVVGEDLEVEFQLYSQVAREVRRREEERSK